MDKNKVRGKNAFHKQIIDLAENKKNATKFEKQQKNDKK